MIDDFKATGTTKASKPDAGNANVRAMPVIGIVKDNIDATRSGRLRVYISDMSGVDPESSDSWTTVSFMSPFFGSVKPTAGDSGFGDFTANPTSYGLWNSPPDIGSEVICIFINGDMNYGFYIGCVPNTEALGMVPAIGASDYVIPNEGEAESYGGALRLPVTNMNTNNAAITDGSNFLNEPKPVHSYSAMIMNQQGTLRDPIRGPISSNAQRESPSRVGFGISTPGRPIYEGGYTDATIGDAASDSTKSAGLKVVSRRGGHTFVMDDGDMSGRDQLVRIRTALGHQITMSDDGQTLMILHSNGQSYVELGKEGTIDLFSTNSVNVRTQGDLNFHADNDVNIHAAKKLNIQAETININADKDFNQKSGTDCKVYTMGKFTHKVSGAMSMYSGGDASYASSSLTYINGSKVNLNSGSTSLIPAAVPQIPIIAHTDTLYDKTKGFAAAPGLLLSIASRAPAHAPWANAGQGVDVKTSMNASDQLPSAPSAKVAAVVDVAPPPPASSAVTPAGMATIPPVNAISKSLDKNTTTALVGSVAKEAATGPLAAAVAAGSGIVNTASGKIASVGSFGQNPAQLEAAGVIKPGSAALVISLIKAGSSVQSALTSNLFTGKPGATNLPTFLQNTTAQANAVVSSLQQAQTALTRAGILTGRESSGSLGGLVSAGASANAGISATINVLKGVTGSAAGVVGAVRSAIGVGSFSAKLASVTGGLGSISSALNVLSTAQNAVGSVARLIDTAKGVAGSAFSAITNSFKPLQANVPQNLTSIAKAQATATAAADAAVSAAGTVNDIATVSGIPGAVDTSLVKAISTGASSLASGLNALPGGARAVASVVNRSLGVVNQIPGTAGIRSILTQASSALTSGTEIAGAASAFITKLKSGTETLAGLANAGLPPAAKAQLNSAISALSSAGASPIQIASVGLNTCNRSEIDSQITSVLGDPKIPAPNFNSTEEILSASEAARAKEVAFNAERKAFQTEFETTIALGQTAKKKYYDLVATLPQGDPQIAAARAAWTAKIAEAESKLANRYG